nr:hypothetical protein [Bacteroidia bacterium]
FVVVIVPISPAKNIASILEIVNEHHGSSFFTIEDVRSVEQGIFPIKAGEGKIQYLRRIFPTFKPGR